LRGYSTRKVRLIVDALVARCYSFATKLLAQTLRGFCLSKEGKMSPRFRLVPLLVVLLALAPNAGGQGPSKHAPSKHGQQPKIDPALVAAANPFVASGCDATLWDHVYHPQRLKVVEKCLSVTGTIHHVKGEADGDDHIQLELDSEFSGLLNDRNKNAQAGCLVVEPICQKAVTQADAVDACRDFHSDVEVPKKGAHVRVLGSYVWDTEAGHGWMEIHPVTKIEVIP